MIFINRFFSLFLLLFIALTTFSQEEPVTISGGFDIDFNAPKKYEIGGIRIDGADNFDHSAIKLISGLRQGMTIDIPGDKISLAIKNLWKEELFSGVEIFAEKEVAGVIYLVIKYSDKSE